MLTEPGAPWRVALSDFCVPSLLLVASFAVVGDPSTAARAAELPPGLSRHQALPSSSEDWMRAGWQWRRLPVAGASGEGGLLAVAVDPLRPGRAAVGHLEGVSLRDAEGPEGAGRGFRFAARVPGVTDLCFAPDGSLWIGSLSGLWQLTREGRLVDRSPAPGEHARRIHRVSVDEALVAVATQAGAWVSSDGATWTRLAGHLPRGPVLVARLEAPNGSAERTLLVLVGTELWRVALRQGDGRPMLASAHRVPIPGAPNAELPRDLATGVAGAEVVVLYERVLAFQEPGRAFRIARPVLPPGAKATRLAGAPSRVWLATDRGLLHAAGWNGPWRRSEAPAGRAAVLALAETKQGDSLLAASLAGLLRGAPVLVAQRPASGVAITVLPPVRPTARPADPDIRSVHAVSLAYVGLSPRRMNDLREGLALRGWIPDLSVRFAAARDRSWGRDDDQSFLSGETRHLLDRDEGKSLDLEASLVMTWELGGLAFDDDAIDISREHRQVVSLRDNVLDEVNQLYFERRGLLERLRAVPAASAAPDPERERMALRAAELAAGLDAWTGGWFSSRTRHPSPGPDPSEGNP